MTETQSGYVFLQAFRTRTACCRALIELSQRQAALISSNDYAALIDLLQQKQCLIDELIGPPDAPWKTWPSHRDTVSPPLRAECAAALAEAEHCLQMLLAEEKDHTELLRTKRTTTEHELALVNHSHQTYTAYHPADGRLSPSQLDVDL